VKLNPHPRLYEKLREIRQSYPDKGKARQKQNEYLRWGTGDRTPGNPKFTKGERKELIKRSEQDDC